MTGKLTQVRGIGPVRRLQTQIEIQAPIDTVWESLTQAEHVAQWWTRGEIGATAGDAIVLDDGESLRGTILVMMKPYVFEFTWHVSLEHAAHPEWIEPVTRGLVRFDMIELGREATLLTMVQFAPATSAAGASAGWHELVERLQILCEGRDIEPSADRFEELKALYSE